MKLTPEIDTRTAARCRRVQRAPRRPERTAGSAALQRLPDAGIEIADRLQVDRSLVARWGTGERAPTPAQRKLLRVEFGIPIRAWNKPPEAPPPPPDPIEAKSTTPLTPASFRAETQRLYYETSRVRELAERYQNEGEVRMYLKCLREAAIQQTLLGRLLGLTAEITEERMLRIPAFRSLVDRILGAIAPWPEALHALIEHLESLESASSAGEVES
jgi:transcriptional regulator with XRE-family HTH domain